MRHFLTGFLFVGLLPATGSAAFGLPWFHTRPKPVLLEPSPVKETRVAWHGTPVYPSTGRLYFKDSVDLVRSRPAAKPKPTDERGNAPPPVTPGTAR
jgi:hypothetical protein